MSRLIALHVVFSLVYLTQRDHANNSSDTSISFQVEGRIHCVLVCVCSLYCIQIVY